MGFKIDGVEWTPKSTTEHAEAIMNKINELLRENNITDESGNVVQLSANSANALYLLALGNAEEFAENDQKLAAAINSFNIELCDDAQISHLLPIAAMTRNTGSYSTLVLTATASEEGPCTIPAGTRAPYGDYYFVTQTEAVIQAGQTQQINTVCDTVGPVVVLSGEITAFENEITNLASVINGTSSIPGVAAETTNELRQRLIRGDTIRYSIDGCKGALEALTGVTYARVYFNYNVSEPITLPGGVVLQPRRAYVVIYGANDQIAYTYGQYMSAETQNAAGAGSRAHSQNYITESGQLIPVKYDDAETQTIYVKIVLGEDTELTDQVENQVKRDLITASAGWTIGQHATSLLMSKPFVNCDYAEVAYALVSSDGQTWSNHIVVGCDAIPQVTDATIIVEEITN